MFLNYIDHADNKNDNPKLELTLVSKLQGVHLIIFHYKYILFAFIVNPFPYRFRNPVDGRQSDEFQAIIVVCVLTLFVVFCTWATTRLRQILFLPVPLG